jgi:hypothetical protein
MDDDVLNLELIEALGCSASTERISFVDNDGVVRIAVENLRQIEKLLQDQGDSLDSLIGSLHKRSFSIPLSSEPGPDMHFISFEAISGSHILMTNSPHADGDVRVMDLRVASFADAVIQQRRYRAWFVAIEIFRESGGDHSMFQLGLYLVDNESQRVAYYEAENIKVTGHAARSVLRRVLLESATCLASLRYDPDAMRDRFLQPARSVCLARILRELGDNVIIVPLEDYLDKLRDIFSYLQGANIRERTKFQHNFDPATKGLLYRVQLLRTNLSRLPRMRHQDTDYAVETYRKPPGHRREEILGRKLCSAAEGEILFLDECKGYLDELYAEAGLTKRHSELAPFHTQQGPRSLPYVDLRYVTILRARNDQPLVMTHWRIRHDQNGSPLPRDRYIDRLQFWSASGQFACLEENKDFWAGIEQVKDISKGIMACAHRIDASSLTTLAQQLVDFGVTLRYERKV